MYTIRTILKAFIIIIVLLWVFFFGIILYAVITDYKPGEKITISESSSPVVLKNNIISLLTWNIGYCGLDRNMDFIYEGGTKVFTPKENLMNNLSAVSGFLGDNDSIDFVFLQEVDRNSRRSYRTDQYDQIEGKLHRESADFAINYNVFFVPIPPQSPIGKVLSGMSIMSRVIPLSSIRYAYPGKYGFLKQLFMFDRCFMVNRYRLENGKDLVIINIQNEALDPEDIKSEQLAYLHDFISKEYSEGNYVITGGDWNQSPPGFVPEFGSNKVNTSQTELDKIFIPDGWTCAYDNKIPTNRTLAAPYNPDITATSVIDYFLLSPNIENVSVRCIDLNFKNSDHNPVIITARLKI